MAFGRLCITPSDRSSLILHPNGATMPIREDVTPLIRVNDKIVQVGALDWSGFKALVEAFAQADLPLPALNDALRQKLAAAIASGMLSLVDLAGLVYEFVTGNLPTLYQW